MCLRDKPVQEDSLAEITELLAMPDQQMADVNIACIIKWLEANHRPDQAEVAAYSETSLLGSMGHSHDERWSAIPSLGITSRHSAQVARDDVLCQLHDSPTGGHYGENKTLDKILRYY